MADHKEYERYYEMYNHDWIDLEAIKMVTGNSLHLHDGTRYALPEGAAREIMTAANRYNVWVVKAQGLARS